MDFAQATGFKYSQLAGSGTKSDKTGKTVPQEEIPDDQKGRESLNEGLTEGAIPPTSGEPNATGSRENRRRKVNTGLHS